MRSEIEELEKLRDEYIQRNQEQGEMINTFMTQIRHTADGIEGSRAGAAPDKGSGETTWGRTGEGEGATGRS